MVFWIGSGGEKHGMKEHQATELAPEPHSVAMPPLPDGWHVVCLAVLADGTLAGLGTDFDLQGEWQRDADGKPIGDPWGKAGHAPARLWTFDGVRLNEGRTFPLLTAAPKLDRFPDGRWLVAGAGNGLSFRILSANGQELERLYLGEGVSQCKIDEAGRVWVSWHDDAKFGAGDMDALGLEWSPLNSGLVAFNEDGSVAALGPGELGIDACYALNVIGETAWACTFGDADFPISSMAVGSPPRWWLTHLSGPRAIAVAGPLVLAAGGYLERSDELVLLRPGDGRATTVARGASRSRPTTRPPSSCSTRVVTPSKSSIKDGGIAGGSRRSFG
jgi:hypothetical protein